MSTKTLFWFLFWWSVKYRKHCGCVLTGGASSCSCCCSLFIQDCLGSLHFKLASGLHSSRLIQIRSLFFKWTDASGVLVGFLFWQDINKCLKTKSRMWCNLNLTHCWGNYSNMNVKMFSTDYTLWNSMFWLWIKMLTSDLRSLRPSR